MSKKSIFKFRLNNPEQESNIVNQIINNYLNSRGFFYNSEKSCYTTGTPTKEENISNAALSAGVSIAATAITGNAVGISYNKIERGFEYKMNGNELIIKAYLITKNGTSFIHSTFNNSQAGAIYYGDLKNNLFKQLANNNIQLASKEVEKINDGSEGKVVKVLLLYFLVLALVAASVIFILTR
ncbi:MAG: hypothetical protein IJI22_03665 [Bacilli bacterium]|nr:hypothetical protein [Bacilli bacterium]